jgi:hypothetical protein
MATKETDNTNNGMKTRRDNNTQPSKKKSKTEENNEETTRMDLEIDENEQHTINAKNNNNDNDTNADNTETINNTLVSMNNVHDDDSDTILPDSNENQPIEITSEEEVKIDPKIIFNNNIAMFTDEWNEISNLKFTKALKPFLQSDIVNKTDNDLSDWFDSAITLMDYPADDVPTIAEWLRAYHYAFDIMLGKEDDDELKTQAMMTCKMAIRFALSDPIDIFPQTYWNGSELNLIHFSTGAWSAAYLKFGAPWKDRKKWMDKRFPEPITIQNKNMTSKTTKIPIQNIHVSFKQPTTPTKEKTPTTFNSKNTKTTTSNMYPTAPLTNPYKTNITKNMKDNSRKYKTFIKLKLAKINSDNAADQEEEASTCLKNIMDKIWSIDPSALIIPWREDSIDKPLSSKKEFPRSRDQMTKFVDRIWIEKSKNAYCRMLMTHNNEREAVFNDDALQRWIYESQLSLNIERIQSRKTGRAGHLMGYHATVANTINLASAIESQPEMHGISVEIRSEFITIDNTRLKHKILQVYVAWHCMAKARRTLIKLYSSAAKGSYPLGVQARFIPNISDTRFIRTHACSLAHTNSLKKHIQFMQSTKTHSSYNIIQLDYKIEKLGVTLRQAIMHILSTVTKWNLFVAVDTSYSGECVNFAFRTELEEEALNMISALPLFLQGTLKSPSVWTWFTHEAREEAKYFKWDPEKGVVPNSEELATNTQLEDWEELDDLDEEDDNVPDERILQPFILDLESLGTNTYGDAGSIKTNMYNLDSLSDDDPPSNPKQASTLSVATTPTTISSPTEINSTSTLTSATDKIAFIKNLIKDDPELALLLHTTTNMTGASVTPPKAEDGREK